MLRRKELITQKRDITHAYRVVHKEADVLPGVVIILNPPKCASNRGQVPGALKAYKDLNRLAISKVKKRGSDSII